MTAPKIEGKHVLLHFNTDGTTTIEAHGYEGGTCMDATKAFEQMYTKVAKERVMTGECVGPRRDFGERVLG